MLKDNKVIKINNELKNKGVSLPDDITFADLLQSWSYLTRFMFDLIEDKATFYSISQAEKTNLISGAELKAFLKYWYDYAEKTIPDNDNFKVVIKEFGYEK